MSQTSHKCMHGVDLASLSTQLVCKFLELARYVIIEAWLHGKNSNYY